MSSALILKIEPDCTRLFFSDLPFRACPSLLKVRPVTAGKKQMDNEFGLLNDNEVLFVRTGRILMANPTFKVSEFLDALAQLISEQEEEWSDEREGWFTDRGQSCEVLRFGSQGWQRGRVRIRLEFCPERPPKLLREGSIRQEDTATYPDEFYPPQDESYPSRDEFYPRRRRGSNYPRERFSQWEGNGERYPEPNDEY